MFFKNILKTKFGKINLKKIYCKKCNPRSYKREILKKLNFHKKFLSYIFSNKY